MIIFGLSSKPTSTTRKLQTSFLWDRWLKNRIIILFLCLCLCICNCAIVHSTVIHLMLSFIWLVYLSYWIEESPVFFLYAIHAVLSLVVILNLASLLHPLQFPPLVIQRSPAASECNWQMASLSIYLTTKNRKLLISFPAKNHRFHFHSSCDHDQYIAKQARDSQTIQ